MTFIRNVLPEPTFVTIKEKDDRAFLLKKENVNIATLTLDIFFLKEVFLLRFLLSLSRI